LLEPDTDVVEDEILFVFSMLLVACPDFVALGVGSAFATCFTGLAGVDERLTFADSVFLAAFEAAKGLILFASATTLVEEVDFADFNDFGEVAAFFTTVFAGAALALVSVGEVGDTLLFFSFPLAPLEAGDVDFKLADLLIF